VQNLDDEKIKWLAEKAKDIRVSIIEMLLESGSGHPGGALGLSDIFATLYFHILKHDPTNPTWEERDRLVISNGHVCPVYYASLAHSGYIPLEELKTLRKLGSRLQGHPDRRFLPFIETTSGPLGCGLSQAVGMTLSDVIDKKNDKNFYCILSDAELQEGNIWEAAMLAGKERLGKLIAIVDRNKIQLSGNTEDLMPLEPLADKWKSFGWHVEEINGHDFNEIVGAIEKAKNNPKSSLIIAHTIPGKGVSFMEGKYEWHGKAPSKEEAEKAIKELKNA
jgi:transketolase